jgi:hypothetical protein
MDHKTIFWIEPEDRISLDYSTEYEQSNALTTRVKEIASTFRTFVEDDDLMINIDAIEKEKHKNISVDEICTIGGMSFIKLTSTRDIARCELNMKKSPIAIMRIISEHNGIVYAEKVNINDLINPTMSYLRNYDVN